jgi:hypothetical protein
MEEDAVMVLSRKDAQIEAMFEAGKELIGNQQKLQMEKLALEKEKMANDKWAFKHRFWLIACVTVIVFAMAAGLIFAKDKVDAGMTMLSHVAALFAGLVGGIGLEKSKKG